jgi:mannose-6-phosphate isomerase-like protein (cupin superfamily)
MAETLAGGCRVSDMHDGAPSVNGTLSVWKQIGRAAGAQAISLRVMEFAPGMSPTMRNGDCDDLIYLLDQGNLAKHGLSAERGHPARILINDCSHEVSPDSGVYIRPGETFAVYNPGPDSITIISSQCPDPDREPEFVDALSSAPARARPPIVRLADQKAQPTADRWYRVLVDDEIGSTQVTQFVGSIPPGRAPDHFHQYEEVLFILKGEGRMWAGDTNTPISQGSCIYLPRGQVHCVENTGEGELRLLGVFYPAGSPSVRYDV